MKRLMVILMLSMVLAGIATTAAAKPYAGTGDYGRGGPRKTK